MLTAQKTDERNYGLVELWNAINDESTWDFRTLNRDSIKHIEKNSNIEDYEWVLGGDYYFIYNIKNNQIRIDNTHKYCTADDIYFGILNSKNQRELINATIDDKISENDKIDLIKGFLQELFTLYQKSLFDIISEIGKAQSLDATNIVMVVTKIILTHSIYWGSYSNQEILTPIINGVKNINRQNIESNFMYSGTENEWLDTLEEVIKLIKVDDTFSDVKNNFMNFVTEASDNFSGVAFKKMRVRRQMQKVAKIFEAKLECL